MFAKFYDTQGQNSVASPASPTLRVLKVAETVAKHGPVTHKELCAHLSISRAAIWRALKVLRDNGWVRMRLGDNAFEIDSELTRRFVAADTSGAFMRSVAPIMREIADAGPFHVEVGCFQQDGIFKIIEATYRGKISSHALSMVDDDIVIAAQLEMPMSRVRQHLSVFQTFATREELQVIRNNEHNCCLNSARAEKVVWSLGEDSFSLPLGSHLEVEGAMRVTLTRVSVHTREKLRALKPILRTRLCDLGSERR